MGTYIRLVDYGSQVDKEEEFLCGGDRYVSNNINMADFPGHEWIYWASDNVVNAFKTGTILGKIANPKQGLITGSVSTFVRLWFECENEKLGLSGESGKKWYPYNSGGSFRKWFGNQENVVDWENDGIRIKNFKDENGKLKSRPQGIDCYFKECVSWSKISTGRCAFRFYGDEFIFSDAGMAVFGEDKKLLYLLGLLNSSVSYEVLKMLSPTINVEAGDIKNVPVLFGDVDEVVKIVQDSVEIEKEEWDSFETSWNFKKHPLL